MNLSFIASSLSGRENEGWSSGAGPSGSGSAGHPDVCRLVVMAAGQPVSIGQTTAACVGEVAVVLIRFPLFDMIFYESFSWHFLTDSPFFFITYFD
jgi:hypothetical protein